MLETVIVGAGPSGLVAAKECLEVGLNPIVFENRNSIGGVWHPIEGNVWHSMKSNLSHFHMGFSDFSWPENISDFPTNQEVFSYLNSYSNQYSLNDLIKLSRQITDIKFHAKWKKWEIEINCAEKYLCQNLILSNGFFSKSYLPVDIISSAFKGDVIHS